MIVGAGGIGLTVTVTEAVPVHPPELVAVNANRWLRDLLGRGATDLANLAYRHTRIDQPEIRALLIAADGSRSAEELAGMDFGIPAGQVPNVLAAAARQALLEA